MGVVAPGGKKLLNTCGVFSFIGRVQGTESIANRGMEEEIKDAQAQ